MLWDEVAGCNGTTGCGLQTGSRGAYPVVVLAQLARADRQRINGKGGTSGKFDSSASILCCFALQGSKT